MTNRAKAIWAIARREISVKLRDRAFILGFLGILAVMIVSMAIPILMNSGTPTYQVTVSGAGATQVMDTAVEIGAYAATNGDDSSIFSEQTSLAAHIEIQSSDADQATLAQLVSEGEIKFAVVGDTPDALTIIAQDRMPGTLVAVVTQASGQVQIGQVADEAGLSQEQLVSLLAPVPPAQQLTDSSQADQIVAWITSWAFAFMFFLSVIVFGQAIAQSVVEEKQSRVVEILVAAIPIRSLLAGKILGNTLLAVGQLVIIVGIALTGVHLLGYGMFLSVIGPAAAWFIAYFIAGFVMLACLWAVAGSLASRFEDLGSTTSFLQFLIMVPFFAGMFVQDPFWMRILSFFPLTAPISMPSRVVSGYTMWWEPLVGLILVVLTAWLLVMIAAKLYSASIMHTSSRLKLKQAWRESRSADAPA